MRLRIPLQVLTLALFATLQLFTAAASAADPQGVVEIRHPEEFTQVLALSDVHGMYEPLSRLLSHAGVIDSKHHWTASKTLLVIVGDSIDKGPNSIGVLDLWIALSKESQEVGGRVIHLLGNHEAEFLAYGKNAEKSKELLEELKKKNIRVSELQDDDTVRGGFLHRMPVAAKVGRWVFCHAGLVPDMKWIDFSAQATKVLKNNSYDNDFLVGEDSVLEAKDWWIKDKHRRKLLQRLEADGIYG